MAQTTRQAYFQELLPNQTVLKDGQPFPITPRLKKLIRQNPPKAVTESIVFTDRKVIVRNDHILATRSPREVAAEKSDRYKVP